MLTEYFSKRKLQQNEITKLFNGLDEYVLANTGLKLQVGKPYGEYFYTVGQVSILVMVITCGMTRMAT